MELCDIDKLNILNSHLRVEIEEVKGENKKLKNKNDILRNILVEFDN